MKKFKILALTTAIFLSNTVFAQNQDVLNQNKSASLNTLKAAIKNSRPASRGGEWNTEAVVLDVIDRLAAEFLNLVVEKNQCKAENIKPTFDHFFKDRLLNTEIVTLLAEPTKSCLNGYLEGNLD